MIPRWPARQVHLDFHTSEQVPDVGARFSQGQFRRALRLGRVNAINLFAKCHHSWAYYPSRLGCGPHPNLAVEDLLGVQIEACHASGVRCPIYYTVGWSATDAERHPEWCVRRRDGAIHTMNYDLAAAAGAPRPTVSWKFMCPSGGYRELMLAQTREICHRYDVDGMWYDICNSEPCWCENCRRGMKQAGLDAASDADARSYSVEKWRSFMAAAGGVMRERFPDGTIFFNGNSHPTTPPAIHACQTHFELEDLPTTWGGYDKFAPRARYFLGLPVRLGGGGVGADGRYVKPVIAMSGKFHTSWGEFGGFKHPDAIRFEAASMVAYGGMCCFGDQLHPSGEMDLSTYANLGAAYEYVQRIEPYGVGARPTANLGVFFSQRPTGAVQHGGSSDGHDNGVCTMLMEGHLDFDAAHRGADWSKFHTVILTGGRCLDAADAEQVRAYLAAGGRLLMLGESIFGVDGTPDAPLLDVGATYAGPPRHDVDYLVVTKAARSPRGLVESPFLNYEAAARFTVTDGKPLANLKEPYFSRTYGRYCSHQNTPNRPDDSGHTGGVQKGRVVFLPHALGKLYHDHGARLHRDLFLNALERLYRKPVLRVDGLPSAARATLVHQPENRRYVLHLLYGPPLQRGRCLVIEDLPVVTGVRAAVRVPEPIRRAGLPLDASPKRGGRVKRDGDTVLVDVPAFSGHQIVTFDY